MACYMDIKGTNESSFVIRKNTDTSISVRIKAQNSNDGIEIRNFADNAYLSVYADSFYGQNSFRTIDGSLVLNQGYNSNPRYEYTISAPTTGMTGLVTIVLPPDLGTNGYVLSTDGAGNTSWVAGGGASLNPTRGFGIDGIATTGTNKALPILIPANATAITIKAYARTAPTGADLIFDINNNGVSIFATAGDRLTIADGSNNSTVGTFTTALLADDVLEVDIDQIGSTVAGADIVIVIEVGV